MRQITEQSMLRALWSGVAVALWLGVVPMIMVGQAVAAPAQTGQGIMVTFNGDQNVALHENRIYDFNITTAATYFTNEWDGNPATVSCSGPGCSTNTAPSAPSAPAPDASKVTSQNGVAVANKCTFLDGGNLIGSSYTQTAQIGPLGSGGTRRTYTYTFTYNINPTGTVAAFTAWDLKQATGGGTAPIDLVAEIAGESVVQNKQVGKKYSFSLRNSDDTSRIVNLVLTVDGVEYPINSSLVENCPGCPAGAVGAVDFAYETNAGMNGVTSLLQDGDARTILNTDTFAGNNDGGADGRALAKAVTEQVTVNLGVGDHPVTLTGTVKGNNVLADLSFSVEGTVHIIAPGCNGN